MVFISRRRTVPRGTKPPRVSAHRCTRAVGTKQGEMCQYHFHCWFGSQCRGCHIDKEEAHFAKCDLMAQDLGAQLEAVRAEQDAVAPHELVEDIFYDTVLTPRRRLHRRVRKKQRARMRRNTRVEFKVFRRAQRCLEASQQTHNVMTQTQPELNSRARETQT